LAIVVCGDFSQTKPVSLSRTASLLNAGRITNRCAAGKALSRFWLTLAGLCFVLAIPARATASGAFVVGVAGSGILYVLAFLPLGVAADFRYAYWCVLAGLVSAVTCALAYRERPTSLA